MEAAAVGVAAAAARGVSLPMHSSQPSRKEWRAVSETSMRNAGNEELDRLKMGQSDERLIYEVQQAREPADVDFCSINVDGGLDNDILQQRLHNVMKQRAELQQMEVEIRAQLIVRSEIMEMQKTYDAQIKQQANTNVKLQEQLNHREDTIRELEMRMQEKERELHAIRLDNEAAWAKEDLLREQDKELATFRREHDNSEAERAQPLKQIHDLLMRERDNSEAERAQLLKQIHDLQEHIQEKERQLMEIKEQHRAAQEAILYKDDQLRDAQSWISRVQEMDALQSTTNHSLQAELLERTEQYNQLWLGCQRQFAELERLHLHQIQQLQLELADARERSGTYTDESGTSQNNSKDVSHFQQSDGSQLDSGGNSRTNGNSGGLPNGNVENVSNFVSTGNTSQGEQVNGQPIAPSMLGMPSYFPPGQVPALHPFVMHQQGVPQSAPSHGPQSHVGHFHSLPAISSQQYWQNQLAVSEGSQVPPDKQYQPSPSEQNLLRSDSNFDYEMPINGQALRPDYLDVHVSQGREPHAVIPSSNQDGQVIDSIDKSYLVSSQPQEGLQQISSQFHNALKLDHIEQKNEAQVQEKNIDLLVNNEVEVKGAMIEPPSSVNTSEAAILPASFSETSINSTTGALLVESHNPTGKKATTVALVKSVEATLLDERSLLACIVRTIPPGSGGRIRISSTLPNRLGKMLAPLHWHDYKKKYGKLDEFVASHPELFMIEGDYIQLREGAQEIIAATAAVAKVAAAAAAVSSYSSWLPSVAVTPVAQSHRLKKIPSIDSKSAKDEKNMLKGYTALGPGNIDSTSHFSQIQHSNGVSFDVSGGVSTVKILTKPKDHELNGSEIMLGCSSVSSVGNGTYSDRPNMGVIQSKVSNQGRTNANFVGKQQGRMTGPGLSSRR